MALNSFFSLRFRNALQLVFCSCIVMVNKYRIKCAVMVCNRVKMFLLISGSSAAGDSSVATLFLSGYLHKFECFTIFY